MTEYMNMLSSAPALLNYTPPSNLPAGLHRSSNTANSKKKIEKNECFVITGREVGP